MTPKPAGRSKFGLLAQIGKTGKDLSACFMEAIEIDEHGTGLCQTLELTSAQQELPRWCSDHFHSIRALWHKLGGLETALRGLAVHGELVEPSLAAPKLTLVQAIKSAFK